MNEAFFRRTAPSASPGTSDGNQIASAQGRLHRIMDNAERASRPPPQPPVSPGSANWGQTAVNFDPYKTFGAPNGQPSNFNPFWSIGAGENRQGAGAYGLPPAYAGWNGAARNAVPYVYDYASRIDPTLADLQKESKRDYSTELYGMSSDAAEAQFSDAKRKREQGFAQAGYGGGGTVSPFAAQQLQLEGAARAGQLGNAARQSVMQAQQMKAEASRNYLNAVNNRLASMLLPAQMQLAGQSKTPLGGNVGPQSLVGPALNAGASLIGAFS